MAYARDRALVNVPPARRAARCATSAGAVKRPPPSFGLAQPPPPGGFLLGSRLLRNASTCAGVLDAYKAVTGHLALKTLKEHSMGRALILWLAGVPIGAIILLKLFGII